MLKWTQLCFTWGPVTRNMKWFKIKTCSQEGWWTNSFIQGNHSVQISVSSGIHCLVGTQPGRYPPTGEVLKSALPWTVVQTEQEEAGSRKQLLNMDGPRDCHTEWSKSNRGEILHDTPYMCNLRRNDTNTLTKQRETGRLRERTCGCLYTLLHLKRITSQDLLCGTGSSA